MLGVGFREKRVVDVKGVIQEFREKFEYKVEEFRMNEAVDVCLIDVNSGSDTKVMVKQVLNWAKQHQSHPSDPFSSPLFTSLSHNYLLFQSILASPDLINPLSLKSLCFQIRSLI